MWVSIRDILVRTPGIRKTNEDDLRKFIEAVYFVLRTSVPWADLPSEMGPSETVYRRFRRWVDKGIWERLPAAVDVEEDGTVMIDSTYVKLHRSGTGARGGKDEWIGRSRGGLTTKIHLVINGSGHILRMLMTAGNASDCRHALPLVKGLSIKRLLADRAYDTNDIRGHLAAVGAEAVIPSRVCRKEQIPHDIEIRKLCRPCRCDFQHPTMSVDPNVRARDLGFWVRSCWLTARTCVCSRREP